MTWRGIVGQGFGPSAFDGYVESLKWTWWRPRFVVLHNTGAPTLKQWHGPTPIEQRMRNLEVYYRDQMHWQGGPHLFIDDQKIWVFTPLTVQGTHSPSWNSISWGVEMVGDYGTEVFSPAVRINTINALATLHRVRGLDPQTLKLHKEDPKTTHDCPGKNVSKLDIIKGIEEVLAQSNTGEHAPGDVG